MKCTNCGYEMTEDASFCRRCGHRAEKANGKEDDPGAGKDIPLTREDIPLTGDDIPLPGEDIPLTGEDIPLTGAGKTEKKKPFPVILIVVGAIVILAVGFGIGILVGGGGSPAENGAASSNGVEAVGNPKDTDTVEEEYGQISASNVPGEAQEFNGHYYLVYSPNQVTTWEEASDYCQNLGGYLATITSQEENAFLTSLITSTGHRSAYVGMSDGGKEGTWTWVTGETVSYQNWRGSEPNDDKGDEDYVMVYDDGSWNDANFIYEEGRPSERNVLCYIKTADGTLNLRAEPKYESDLAYEVTSDTTLMKFYGQVQQGLGSDGQMHDWYKVYIGSYVSGWVRSDLIKQVDQKLVQGNDGVAFICEWGPYTIEKPR